MKKAFVVTLRVGFSASTHYTVISKAPGSAIKAAIRQAENDGNENVEFVEMSACPELIFDRERPKKKPKADNPKAKKARARKDAPAS